MRTIEIEDYVMLTHDMPEHDLHSGAIGIIKEMRYSPHLTCEVEFLPEEADQPTRIVLAANDFQPAPRSPFDLPGADGRSLYI